MVVCVVFDIDDTIYVHKTSVMNYDTVEVDPYMKQRLQTIPYPKYVLTNATYGHANTILNKMDIVNEFKKIYARDNIPEMKPHLHCYDSVYQDISQSHNGADLELIFFDDMVENLAGAKARGWRTVWISPNYQEIRKHPFIDRAFPVLNDALDALNF
jgi:FMN phosphatase YigB (HAD superfamily)